jgi:hypothetical protein
MIQIAHHRSLSWGVACSDGKHWERGIRAIDGEIKAPTAVVRMWLVGLRFPDDARCRQPALSENMARKSTGAAPSPVFDTVSCSS